MILRTLLILWCATAFVRAEVVRRVVRVIDAIPVTSVAKSKPPAKVSKPPEPILRWNNLEAIPGALKDSSATELSWQSPLFEDALRLQWNAIRRIDQTLPAQSVSAPFGVVLRDGSHLLGELVRVDADSVILKSERHGEVALKRSEVLRLQRLKGSGIIAAGPVGDSGWAIEESKNQNAQAAKSGVPELAVGSGGALVFPYWNTAARYAAELPPRVDFAIELSFSEFPEFSLLFDGDEAQGITLETWDDELVVVHGNEFQAIRKIDEKERQLALRVCWDREARKGAIYDAAGELLGEWKFNGELGSLSGWRLQNKGRDLTVNRFSIREWDGNPPAKMDPTKARIELTNGRALDGDLTGIADDTVTLAGNTAGAESAIALADVAQIVFSNDEPKSDPKLPLLTFADGTRLSGRIASIIDGTGTLETNFTAAPLSSAMAGLRQLRMPDLDGGDNEPGKPPLPQDEIVIDSTQLHGSLASTGDDRLHWLPIGGVTPAAVTRGAKTTVSIKHAPEQPSPQAPALFYTRFGDIVPGNLRGLDRQSVEIESEVVETKKLATNELDAVQFGDVAQAAITGFDSPGWRIVKGDENAVKVSAKGLEMKPGSAYGHPSALQGGEIRFGMAQDRSQNMTALRLRLFSPGTEAGRTTNIVIAIMGGTVYAGEEGPEGEMQSYNNSPAPSDEAVQARIEVKEGNVGIWINDRVVYRVNSDARKRPGTGLVLEPASVFGNDANAVAIYSFTTPIEPGITWMPEISSETKTQALTIPRFRKERAPKHALVAVNGDVLRGEIEGTTPTHFGFLAGLEKLRVPRNRVNAAIWLKPPRSGVAPKAPEATETQKLLSKLTQRNVSYGGASLQTLLSVLSREAPALKFDIKAKPDNRGTSMAFNGQTIGEALDQICTMFDVQYRVLNDGRIAIEEVSEDGDGFVQKVYWLDIDDFAKAESARAILKEKGVEFPEGTSTSWDPDTRQLTITQTVAAQKKIEEILREELGAKPSSLTHWVLMRNGARLGLAVEKFGPDFIVGRHPAYGRCRLPMAEVFAIQTNKPAPTAVMQEFANWNLVPAPEPDIPDSDGGSSPAVGKEAEKFKLPLLTEGEFDLGAEQGKIVVLDFWATWCAPCVKSLPGLIEAVSAFPSDRVRLIGVNQSEPAEAVKRFIETRNWNLTVAMDADQKVAQKYGVTGIPHTVIVGPDGKIAWVKTGYSPDGATEAAAAIQKLLASAKPAEEAATPATEPPPAVP